MQSRNLKPLPAARILALSKVIAAQHIRPHLLKARAIPLIRVASERALLGALQPADLVRTRLMAEKAGEICRFQDFFFVEKVSFFHAVDILP